MKPISYFSFDNLSIFILLEDRKNIELSYIQVQVNTLVNDTLKDVSKVELDIKKLPSRGVLQLNYAPDDDVPNRQQNQVTRDIEKLKGIVENLKTNTLMKVDELTTSLPSEQRNIIRQMAEEKLVPGKNKQDKTLSVKEKSSVQDKGNSIEGLQIDSSIADKNRFIFSSKFGDVKGVESQTPDKLTQTKFSNFLHYQPGRNDNNKDAGLNKDNR